MAAAVIILSCNLFLCVWLHKKPHKPQLILTVVIYRFLTFLCCRTFVADLKNDELFLLAN